MQKVFTTWSGGKKLIHEDKIIPRHSSYSLVLSEGKILLITLKTSDKLWFPGGAIEKEESPEAAAVRETLEETGLVVRAISLLTEVENNFYYDPQDIAWRQMSSFYVCEPLSTDLVDFVNPDLADEADKPVWLSLEEIREDQMQDYGFEIIKLLLNK